MRGLGKAIRNCYENRLFSFFIRGLGRPSAILSAAGIQSPFPHPTWCVSAGMFKLDVNLSTRRVLVGITVLVHNRGSGIPRRRE